MTSPDPWYAASVLVTLVGMPAAVLAQPAPAALDEPRITETDGLALSAGVGTQYVLAGGQAAYYFQIPHSLFRVAPYVAAGVGWCGQGSDLGCAFTLGAMGSWGHKQRIFLDLGYGPQAKYSFTFHGEPAHDLVLSGPFLEVGFEYMAFSGFCLRTAIGMGYLFGGGSLLPDADRPTLALTLLGIGFKLW